MKPQKSITYHHIRFLRTYLIGLILCLNHSIIVAQSDHCADAISIPIHAECIEQEYEMDDFDNDGPDFRYITSPKRDGWYTVTTDDTTTALRITATCANYNRIALALYSSCEDTVEIASSAEPGTNIQLYAPVSPNTTYWLRLCRTTLNSVNNGTICVEKIKAIIATYSSNSIATEYRSTEPSITDTSACAAVLSLTIPEGQGITTVSTLYYMNAISPAKRKEQRSHLSCVTTSFGETQVSSNTINGSGKHLYERHNLTIAEGATGEVSFQLNAWRTEHSGDCNSTYNEVLNHTWTIIAYYEPATTCYSPSVYSISTTDISSTTASFVWTAPNEVPSEGYEYFISTVEEEPSGSGTLVPSSTSVTATGLDPSTYYYFYIRGKCGNGAYGEWAGPFAFHTEICPYENRCQYMLHMNSLTNSGWGGNIIGFRQNGIEVATATMYFSSSGTKPLSFCIGETTEIFVKVLNNFSEELGFTLVDAAGDTVFTHPQGTELTENYVFTDFLTNCPDCQSPLSVTATYPSSTTLDITWVAPNSVPANGYEYVLSTSAEYPEGVGIATSDTTITLGSLLPATTYYFFVRSICSPTLSSNWTAPVSFTTSCEATTLPLIEGLNSAPSSCWNTTIVENANIYSGILPTLEYASVGVNPNGITPVEGTGFIRFNSYYSDNGDKIRLESAPFSTMGIDSTEVSLIWHRDADFDSNKDAIQLQYSFDRVNWFNTGDLIHRYYSGRGGWYPYYINLPAEVANHPHVYLGVLFISKRGNNCHLDQIVVRETPTCKPPKNVSIGDLLETEVTMNWESSPSVPSSGYEWELRTSGAPGSGPIGLVAGNILSASATSVSIDNLQSLSEYTFYIRSNCGDAYSDWTWPTKIRTTAPVFVAFPFVETFEEDSPTRDAWTNDYITGSWNWVYAEGAGSGEVETAHNGSLNARFRTIANSHYRSMLISPPLNISVLPAGARLKFWYSNEQKLMRQNELRVYYKADYSQPWTLIPTAEYMVDVNEWTEVSLNLPGSGTHYYVAFEGVNKSSHGIALDDILVEAIECPIPTPEAVAGRNSAFIHWQVAGNGNALQYEWQVRTSGDPVFNGPGLVASGTTSTGVMGRNIGGLVASTTYYLYVRTICSEDDQSLWSEGYEFTTSTIPPPSNDHYTNSISLNNVGFNYPNCTSISGTTIGATPYTHEDYNDVWYQFNATTNGVTIRTLTCSFDGAIQLYDSGLNLLDEENLSSTGGTEILNYGNLIPGNTYYIAISNYLPSAAADAAFTFCISRLRDSKMMNSSLNLCNGIKCYNYGAQYYTFHFTPTGDTPGEHTQYTCLGPALNNWMVNQLSLQWNGTYDSWVDAHYYLADGLGNQEIITVLGNTMLSATALSVPLTELQTGLDCNETTLTRNHYISPRQKICYATNYSVEFTPVEDCMGTNPNPSASFIANTPVNSYLLKLNNAFNQGGIPIAGNNGAGYWQVRWKANVSNGTSEFGAPYIIHVTNTVPSQGLISYPAQEPLAQLGSSFKTTIYPNPNTGDVINLQIISEEKATVSVRITDATGRLVSNTQHHVEGSYTTQLTFQEELPSGMYLIEYNNGTSIRTDKLLIHK